ncbi:Gfo/Idh/MocA family oxidoreductase [Nocardioides sp. KIGAM211]|uniref:Gfo/Idh/MocA family oxidoreductase n=2 Tax=Nocardioides luti TaxID=2761101 RepID=A0A7X0RFU0_9ACTN|nr:Gfo/Idh/MocA family oxidoreductase [Nocardioides luti]MBB6627516.1 Gfo/Idh/MocA family oxidoreductase [Nocardioides luti]
MTRVEDGEITAVTSRTRDSADSFGDQWNVTGRYTDLDAMLADPAVEAVYVATPHPRHVHDAIRSMEARKPVLCEKSMAMNASEVQRMLDAAAANGVFRWRRSGAGSFLPTASCSSCSTQE